MTWYGVIAGPFGVVVLEVSRGRPRAGYGRRAPIRPRQAGDYNSASPSTTRDRAGSHVPACRRWHRGPRIASRHSSDPVRRPPAKTFIRLVSVVTAAATGAAMAASRRPARDAPAGGVGDSAADAVVRAIDAARDRLRAEATDGPAGEPAA